MEIWMHQLLHWLALPQFGLSTVFVVVHLGHAAAFGLRACGVRARQAQPRSFWPAIGVATVGNTPGGAVSWWMGLGAHKAVDRARAAHRSARTGLVAPLWPRRLPAELAARCGRPAVRVAGWLKLPFWPCVAYMAVGKFFRYLVMTSVLLYFMPGQLGG